MRLSPHKGFQSHAAPQRVGRELLLRNAGGRTALGDDVLLYDHLRLRRTAIYNVLSGRNKRGLYKFCTVTRMPQDTFVTPERCVRVDKRGRVDKPLLPGKTEYRAK